MLSVLQWFIGLGSTGIFTDHYFHIRYYFGVKPAKAAISGLQLELVVLV